MTPTHVAIIMDGNGRWASVRGLPRTAGHRAGRKAVRAAVEAAVRHGVEWLSLFVFSAENWQRPNEEVQALFELLNEVLREETAELVQEGVRIRFIGAREDLPATIQEQMSIAEQVSAAGQRLNLVGAINYGGRQELIRAVSRMNSRGAALNETELQTCLDLPEMPDPDLIIRTAGEFRISNFLLWQSAYSEFWATEVLWPDFGEEDFGQALAAYQQRERRFGRISPD